MKRYGHKTEYTGIVFRSKLEVEWAQFFDKWHLQWKYEPKELRIDGIYYQPDFVITNSLGYAWATDLGILSIPMPQIIFEIKPDIPYENLASEYKKVEKYLNASRGSLQFALVKGTPLELPLILFERSNGKNKWCSTIFCMLKSKLSLLPLPRNYQGPATAKFSNWWPKFNSTLEFFLYLTETNSVTLPPSFLRVLAQIIANEFVEYVKVPMEPNHG